MRIKYIVSFNQGRDEAWAGIGVLLKSSAKQNLCMSVRSRLVGKCMYRGITFKRRMVSICHWL